MASEAKPTGSGWKTAFWSLFAATMTAPLSERAWGWHHFKTTLDDGAAIRCVIRSADWTMPWWLWGGYAIATGALFGLVGFLWYAGGKIIAARSADSQP